jgi:long-chain acyl-CoA synthetase
VLDSGDAGPASDTSRIVVGGDGTAGPTFDAWVRGAPSSDAVVEAAPDDVALQLYTSGTTGPPKGAMISHRNLATMLPSTARAWYFGPDSVNLVAMPLFHVGGVGWALVGVHAGAHTVLLHEVDTGEILRAISRHRVTHALFVPAVLQALLATPEVEATDFSSLRYIVYGASPISVDVLTRSLERFGCGFIQGYGLTETTGAVVHLLPEDHDPTGPNVHRLRAAGQPMPGVELRVVEPRTGQERATGEVGEVLFRSAQVMRAYWNRPEATTEVIDDDGWFRTGDAGHLDADGYLYLSDRVKDMIISGGENIYPAEVENVLMSCDAIADAAVIGVPSEKWDETPRAIIVLADGAELSPEQVIAHCRSQLASYKCPTSVEFVAELPRNAAGKILKRELRAPYWDQRERHVN